jgi:restriction system protein
LRCLADYPDGLAAREVHEKAADILTLAPEDRQVMLPSGAQLIYKNRAGWAHDRLKRAGLSSAPRRGVWKITDDGKKVLSSNPGPFPDSLVEKIAIGYIGERLSKNGKPTVGPEGNFPEQMPASFEQSPDDRLGHALQEIRQSTEAELLELLAVVSPSFFETIVLDLLHRMGYGASRADLQRVGGSGDAGIDGVISLDKLGLEKVYVQAKRWQNNVGRPDLQAFYGALAGQKARKGVYITTSSFTAQAIDFARSVDGIVLIDGDRLAGLMVDFELGISAKTIKVPKVDGDYFDEEAG